MHTMEGRESKGPPPSADLFVCFPSRVSHLTLIPKPICSPARSSEPNNRHLLHRYYHLKRSSKRGVGAGQASPLLWAKTKSMSKEIDEPTSPRVNCAGKIKVRTTKESGSSCGNWESSAAMEEMEKLHRSRKLHKKKKKKKNAMQEFLPCLTRIRIFHFQCFGSFSAAELPSDDEGAADDHEDGDYGENQMGRDRTNSEQCGAQIAKINVGTMEGSDHDDGNNEISRTVFSKWLMVLQEDLQRDKSQEEELVVVAPPPPNALLLMRCRSAPARSRLEVRDQEEKEGRANDQDRHDHEEKYVKEEEEEQEKKEEEEEKKGKLGMDEEESKGKKLGVVMRYDIDLCKFSSNFAKDTWVVGDVRNPLPKSRSWRR